MVSKRVFASHVLLPKLHGIMSGKEISNILCTYMSEDIDAVIDKIASVSIPDGLVPYVQKITTEIEVAEKQRMKGVRI